MTTPFFENAVALAPMAGFTDLDFRLLCREYGCDLAYTEMVSAKGLDFGNVRTGELLYSDSGDSPLAVQLFGSDPEVLGRTAELLSTDERFTMIDFNCGCPAPKITKNGDGSALMRDLPLAGRCIEALVRHSSLPVSVKFRKGWDAGSVNAAEFAVMAEQSGAAMLTVHGRTREQQYSGRSDNECIRRVVQSVSIPVFGNGDVTDGASALRMKRETGCMGITIGRGALGRPFVFTEIKAALEGRPYEAPDEEARIALAIRHAEAEYNRRGAHSIIELRKHLSFYLSGVRNAAKLRVRLNEAKSVEEIKRILLDSGDTRTYNN